MTSKLVVNTIEADTGISSVSFASSISMSSTSKFHFSDAGIDIGADTNINRPAAGVLGFNINGGEKVRITSTGRVGIGTDNPDRKLHVAGSFIRVDDGYGLDTSGSTEKVVLDNGYISLTTNSNERLHITSDGKVGINRTPTQHPLEIQHASEPTVSLWRGSTKGAALQAQSGGTYLYSYQNAPLVFSVNSGSGFAERLSITNAGQVKIPISGKLAVGPTSPSARFTVGPANGSTNIEIEDYGVIRGYNRNSSAWSKIEFEGSYYVFDTDGTEKFRITSQGYVTAPNQPSFNAYINGMTSESNNTGTQIMPFNATTTNVGGHFKTSGTDQYKFVAPVAGNYYFSLSQNHSARVDTRILKNNVNYHGGESETSNMSWWDHHHLSCVIPLAAGDKVHCTTNNQDGNPKRAWNSGTWESFAGFLIG